MRPVLHHEIVSRVQVHQALDPCGVSKLAPDLSGRVAALARYISVQRPDCPRVIVGGVCEFKCESDSDCSAAQICCSNGCGRECVFPLPMSYSLNVNNAIQPVNGKMFFFQWILNSSPVFFAFFQCILYLKCSHDGNCANVEKCCTIACGKVCVDPTTATNCIHLFVAVKKLPNKALKNNYVPKCDEHGKFDRIQCDQHQCWCVDVNNGTEIAGSAVPISMRRADMCREVRLCGVKCLKQCTYGLKMSVFGCPDPTCECRDICEGIRCNNDGDVCQLIEPDCARPPCLPVPKFRNNHSFQILLQIEGTLIRVQIGYNGYGFCCSGAELQKRGACPSVTALRNTSRCSSICRMDEDCVKGSEWISSVTSSFFIPMCKPLAKLVVPAQLQRLTRLCVISSHVADCPSSLEIPLIDKFTECNLMCEFDNECAGLKRCCRVGCSAQCLYPIRTTPCLNAALTAELYDMPSIRRCDQNGQFEQIQCDDGVCFCVDVANGEEIPGTRTANDTPNCKEPIRGNCPDIVCRTSCPYGMERSEYGCLSCRCRNPCAPVRCPQGSFCIMTAVNCFEMDNCPPQPRCILNLCPHGDPFVSQLGVVETCNSNEQCPPGHWCHQIGFSSSGLCCPSPLRLMHIGTCPLSLPQLDQVSDCRFDCRADDDCNIGEKCCYDGCGLRCKGTLSITDHKNRCSWDSECDGVQKCCSDGCGLKCLHPEENSVCLHMKAALQMIGQAARIQCRADGSFEEIQCDADYCWCVNESGLEVEGTRSSEDTLPNCRAPRKCQIPSCTHDISCKFGMKKDSNGCDTCECSSPCDVGGFFVSLSLVLFIIQNVLHIHVREKSVFLSGSSVQLPPYVCQWK
uniref:Thyroglobulin type-1 domain-containing protein n=1 Tax=Angiostrongylus cantonensis TaxID=6313 RepID=A0A0K0DLK1_ANGCA